MRNLLWCLGILVLAAGLFEAGLGVASLLSEGGRKFASWPWEPGNEPLFSFEWYHGILFGGVGVTTGTMILMLLASTHHDNNHMSANAG